MVAGAFPIAKLGILAVRQISKPLANRIKEKAKSNRFFRTYICMPPAQLYHWLEVTVKMKLLNLGKPSEVPKLNETMAIELGAELLGETIIFSLAALTITAEYIRQSRKESNKETEQENRLKNLEQSLENLQKTIEQQNTTIDELTKQYNEVKQKSVIGKLIEKGKRQIAGTSNLENDNASTSSNAYSIVPENQGLINYAIFDVTNYFGLKQLCTTDTKSVEEITYVGEPCFTCQVCSKLGLDYPLPQKIHMDETFHSKKKTTRHDFVQKALNDALLIIRGNSNESLKCKLKLAKPSKKTTVYSELKYPGIPTKQPESLFHQSLTTASECICGKKDTRKFEFDSQFLTAVEFADETDGNLLYDFNLLEIADDASSVFLGQPNVLFSSLSNKCTSPIGDNKYRDEVKSEPGIFGQALYDAIDCIIEERQNKVSSSKA